MEPKQIHNKFKALFEKEARLFRSPGRINIIGEHTDYNNGYVLPAAIDKDICMAIGISGTELFRIYSLDTDEEIQFTIDNYRQNPSGWPDYILGVIDYYLRNNHELEPFDCVFGGDIPIGAGMSSSAALSCVTAYAFNSVFESGLSQFDIINIAQGAEIDYAGLNCGIMDQFASVFSKKDHVSLLDCRDMTFKSVPIKNKHIEFVLVNSMVSHKLADSAYNDRRKDCEESVKILQKNYQEVNSLRDADIEMIKKVKSTLSKNQFKRSEYIINENDRVNKAVDAILDNDMLLLGKLMNESHAGLRDDYEVSCIELDFLQKEAIKVEGVFGSRMMGGGFGGCTINLVKKDKSQSFTEKISALYKTRFGLYPETYLVNTSNGSSEIQFSN